VAHILPLEDAGLQTLVTRPYFSPEEYRPASKQERPTPRKPKRTMSKKSKNDKKSKSSLDTKHSGVNGQPKIGKNEYEAEIFKLQVGRQLQTLGTVS